MAGLLIATLTLPSCYTSNFIVGDGPQRGIEEVGKNHFFLYGLAPGKQVNVQEMAKGAEDYRIKVQMSFVDGLIGALTFGIYVPRTVEVSY